MFRPNFIRKWERQKFGKALINKVATFVYPNAKIVNNNLKSKCYVSYNFTSGAFSSSGSQ